MYAVAYGKYYGQVLGPWKAPGWYTVKLLAPPTPEPGTAWPWTGPVNEQHIHEIDLVYSDAFFNLWEGC